MANSVPMEVWLFICQELRILENPLPRGLHLSDFSWPDWDNRRIMYSQTLTYLSCTSRHFRIMLESEVFKSLRLRFNRIGILYHKSKAPKDQTLARILSFVRELAVCPHQTKEDPQGEEFQPKWSTALSWILRSAPLLERLHMYRVRFEMVVIEAIHQCNLVHLLTSSCEMHTRPETTDSPLSQNSRLKTLCHSHPTQVVYGTWPEEPTWAASFFVPSLTHLILYSTLDQYPHTLHFLSQLHHLRHFSVVSSKELSFNFSNHVGAVLSGSKDLEQLQIRPFTFTGLQIICPSLPRLRRLSCQLRDLHQLLPGNPVDELELDADWDGDWTFPTQPPMTWNELLSLIQLSEGNIKKLAFIENLPFSTPCEVVPNIVSAFPNLQELKLTVDPGVCEGNSLRSTVPFHTQTDISLPLGCRPNSNLIIRSESASSCLSHRPAVLI